MWIRTRTFSVGVRGIGVYDMICFEGKMYKMVYNIERYSPVTYLQMRP